MSDKLGSNIRCLRKRNKLTQRELGEKLGLKHNTVADYESGANKPSISSLITMSKLFDVTIDELVDNQREDIISNEWRELVLDLIDRGYDPDKVREVIKLVDKLKDILQWVITISQRYCRYYFNKIEILNR